MPSARNRQKNKEEPFRFAHPFFQEGAPEQRAEVPGVGRRMIDYIQGTLEPVPAPKRLPQMLLSEIIGTAGSDAIEALGTIRFHVGGDTGLPPAAGETPQQRVADAMTLDYNIAKPATCPAFFYHLGDVIYGPNKDANYRGEFYEAYRHYPGKIVGIPGNHDGEVFASTDRITLGAFLANFCTDKAVVPPVAGSTFRHTITQPGVYWLLDAPFVQIVGLYSNCAENPGFISGQIPGQAQKDWLISVLKGIGASRAKGRSKFLVFTTHHPPFSSGGHSGSTQMLADIDDACQKAGGVFPNLFLSGHAHSYQRYTRVLSTGAKKLQITYLVVGCAGHGAQPVLPATGKQSGDLTYERSYDGYGYGYASATANSFQIDFYTVSPTTGAKALYDSFTLTH